MGNEYGIYDGRAIRPILKAHAKKVGMSYPEVRKQFIEKIAAPATKRFEHMAPQLIKKTIDGMIESAGKLGIELDTKNETTIEKSDTGIRGPAASA